MSIRSWAEVKNYTDCIQVLNWPRFFEQAFEHTTPGGYIEVIDVAYPYVCDDGTMGPGSALREWNSCVLEACEKMGRRLDIASTHKTNLEKAGYVDIELVVTHLPTNTWPRDMKYKEIGMWRCEMLTTGISGISMALFTRGLGWTSEQVEVFLVDVKKEIKNTEIHAYIPL